MLWQMRVVQAVLLTPTIGTSCDSACYTNLSVTVTGGDVVYISIMPQPPPTEGGLVIFDCAFLQKPGAADAIVTLQNSCAAIVSTTVQYPGPFSSPLALTHHTAADYFGRARPPQPVAP